MIPSFKFQRMESGGLHALIEGIVTIILDVEAGTLPNFPQSFRGREQSKRGYGFVLLTTL